MSLALNAAAARVVADLMPVAIVVADAGGGAAAGAFADALGQAGAGAEIYAPGGAGGFDLAVLLADPDPGRHQGVGGLIEGLAAISDRLLFVPSAAAADGGAPDLNGWFELFAEQGYQPVVEYDAGFLGQGAFLVDRNATAAETELSAFADRLSMGGALAASTQRVAALEAELGTAGDREAVKAALAARQAELAACHARAAAFLARAEAAEAALDDMRVQLDGWQSVAKALGAWVHHVCGAPGRDTLAGLRAVSGLAPKPRFLARFRPWRRAEPTAAERLLLADAALVRASGLFDAGWYIASHPALAGSGADPVLHYVAAGAASGADPGPYFDTAAYRAAHPDCAGAPLAHAIRHGHVDTPRGAVS
jgi:hypothetical protein